MEHLWNLKCMIIPVIISHWNSNKRLKEKFGSHSRKMFSVFTTMDSYTWNVTHNTENFIGWNLKPERWGPPLVQEEKYQGVKPRVFSEWFWDGSSCLHYYWYHFCFYIPHAHISVVRSLYFRIISSSFLTPEIATSINIHAPFSLLWFLMSSLLLEVVVLACTCWYYVMGTLSSLLVSPNFGTCLYHCS